MHDRSTLARNQFNLLRLIAACQVLVVHGLNHLYYSGPLVDALKLIPGVPVFFFISGLLIHQAYVRSRARSPGLGAFFRNRALRIFPALWCVVLASAVMLTVVGYLQLTDWRAPSFWAWLFAQLSFAQFYNPDFLRGFGAGVLNGALWTISVELQFYLLMPVLAWLMARHRRVFAALFLVSMAVNLGFRWYGTGGSTLLKLLYVSALPWVYMFMSGMLVSANLERVRTLLDRWAAVWLVALLLAASLLIGDYHANASNAIHPLSFALVAALVLKAGFPRHLPDGPVFRFVRDNDLSYGMYLVHMPLINLLLYCGMTRAGLDLAIVFVASALWALLSWFLIERPALSRKA
jgi:peptidoglycan/LPS O-acetylase OafA/YrhL